MPFRAQRPERCVSTSFTTSAEVSCGQGYHTVTLANCQEVFWVLGWALLEFSFSRVHLSSAGKRVIISVRYPVKSLSLAPACLLDEEVVWLLESESSLCL